MWTDGSNQTVKLTTEDTKAYTDSYEELVAEGINLDICAWGDFYMVDIDMYQLWNSEGFKVSSFSQYMPT